MKFRTPIVLLLAAILGWSAPACGQVSISLVPKSDTIDFGRVLIGSHADSEFTIINSDTSKSVLLMDVIFQDSVRDSDFRVAPLNTFLYYPLGPSASVKDSVHFKPTKEGRFVELVRIRTSDTIVRKTLVLIGQGVRSRITTADHDFGAVRVGGTVATNISIVNAGGGMTVIDSITLLKGLPVDSVMQRIVDSLHIDSTIVQGVQHFDTTVVHDTSYVNTVIFRGISDTTDFQLDLSPFPPASGSKVTLQYKGDTVLLIPIKFSPRSLGKDSMALRIHTTANQVVFATLRGTGVEPLVTLSPGTINFDTITVTTSAPAPVDTFFTVSNTGTLEGQLYLITHTDTAHFHSSIPDTLDQVLYPGSTLTIHETFIGNDEGDFADTIHLSNDTRYSLYDRMMTKFDTVIVQRAFVRTAPLIIPTVFVDTVRTCDTVFHSLLIHNTLPVAIRIDTITFDSTAAGLSMSPKLAFSYPINIPAGGSYPLDLAYGFPPDSLNGLQQMILHFIQRRSDELAKIGTANVQVFRLRQELTLHALLPTFVSSANDVAPLRLPIKIEGPRAGVHELDAWTLALTFSNDLFEPTGLDTSGGLVTAHDTTPFSLSTSWDQPTRTYKITVSGAKLSDSNSIYNLLLFNVKMRAYLTMDTSVTVTPTFTFVTHPCAYSLLPFTLTIPYANDCGDVTIRSFLLGDAEPFRITGLWPDPAGADGVSISYDAAQAMQLSATVSDAAGKLIGTHVWTTDVGSGMQKLPADLLPHSGAAYLTVEAHSTTGALLGRRSLKLSVDR